MTTSSPPSLPSVFDEDFPRRREEVLAALVEGASLCWYDALPEPDTAAPRTTFAPQRFGRPERGFWTVVGYDDVLAVKRDPGVFSNSETITYRMTPGTFEWQIGSRRLSGNDGQPHDVVRRLCGKQMRPSVLRSYIEVLRDKARRGLDDVEVRLRSGATVDWVSGFAHMYPVFGVGTLIGLPESLMDDLAASVAAGTPPGDDVLEGAFRDFVAFRVDHPAEDMCSELIAAAAGGSPYLQLETLHFNLLGFYLAGHLTTTHLMAWVLVELQRQDGVRARLRDQLELIPGFIEETLRFDPPVVTTFNNVLSDTVFNGCELKEGDHVYSVYAAANRDPRVFEDPFSFDISRSPNPHLAFSHGTHFCLGAPLARLETKLMLEDLLQRDLDIAVDFDNATLRQNTFVSLSLSMGG